jgi:ankyrin repeat protein
MALAQSRIHSKVNTQCSIIQAACLAGEIDVVRKYISDRRSIVTADNSDDSENDLLHLASIGGHMDLVSFLIEEGANVNAKASEGLTALHLCGSNDDNVELAKLHISKQATVHTKRNGGTPLSFACKLGRINIVKYLVVENGADTESKDQFGKTPIDIAR